MYRDGQYRVWEVMEEGVEGGGPEMNLGKSGRYFWAES